MHFKSLHFHKDLRAGLMGRL